jgi:tRNA(Ile)-lysidine synthase
MRRDDIEAFLKARGLEYCSDETNVSRQFARNKIRADVIPLLQREFNPRVVDSIVRTAQVVRSAEEWVNSELERGFDQLVLNRDEAGLSFSMESLINAPAMLRRLAIRRAIREYAIETLNRSLAHLEATEALLFSDDEKGQMSLPAGWVARRVNDRLEILRVRQKESGEAWSIPVTVPGTCQIPDYGKTLTCEAVPRSSESSDRPTTQSDEAFMDWDQVEGDLVIRNRRPGDRFHPLGAPGSRKLKDFFIDAKVPQAERDRIPLLADDEGIICVLGHVIADRVRVHAETQTFLHIVLR